MFRNLRTEAALLGGLLLAMVTLSGCGYGPEQTVTVEISGVADDAARDEITEALKTMTDSSGHSISTTSSGDSMKVTLAPVSDVDAFAKKIKFGEVTEVRDRVVKVSIGGDV
jgi:hypothetical protein